MRSLKNPPPSGAESANVSKTTTQEKARAYVEARFVNEWQQNILVPCFVDFADSLTAELQKENARLREALEKISSLSEFGKPFREHDQLRILQVTRAALSKEKAK